MSKTFKVHLSLFIVSLIYGATFTIAKEVMPLYVKPFAFIMLRIWVAAIFLFLFHRAFIKEKISDKSDFKKLIICSIFGVVANMLFFFKGLSLTVPINASVLMMTHLKLFILLKAGLILVSIKPNLEFYLSHY